MQNLSGSASHIRAQEHPEIAGLNGLFPIPQKLQFTVSWNYLSEVAHGIRNDTGSAVAPVASPEAPVAPVTNPSPADPNEPKWEMVIPKMSRPAAKPAAPLSLPRNGKLERPGPAERPTRRLEASAVIAPESQFAPTFGTFTRSRESWLNKLPDWRPRTTLPDLTELAVPWLPDLTEVWALAERYRIAILSAIIAALFGLIMALWAGGPSR